MFVGVAIFTNMFKLISISRILIFLISEISKFEFFEIDIFEINSNKNLNEKKNINLFFFKIIRIKPKCTILDEENVSNYFMFHF